MIKINLLPQNSQKGLGGSKGATVNRGAMLVVLLALLMAALNGGALWMALSCIWTAKAELAGVQSKLDLVNEQIQKRMTEAEQVKKFRDVVKNQMDVLQSLDPPERMLWCEKLNMLSNLIPADVFISEINVTEQVEMVETEASKAARLKWEKAEKKVGTEPAPVKRPLISYLMKVTGVALGRDNVEQFNNVMKFHKAMTTYSIKDAQGRERKFMDGFDPNINLGSIEATVSEGEAVNQFTFTLRTKTMGEEKKPEAGQSPQVAAAGEPGQAGSLRGRAQRATSVVQ